jgi:predicted lipoprotein
MLGPVLDFSAHSAAEAYMATLPPKVRDAIKDHKVLVGMNREMVTYAKGRAPQKTRERDGNVAYEEWIYGAPPQEVEFVRFVGDEVVRVETMKVDGTKAVDTQKQVDIKQQQPTVAQQQPQSEPGARAPGAPTLRRPGEDQQGQGPLPKGGVGDDSPQ